MECDPYECINECREKYDPEIMIVGVGSRGVILYTKKDNSILEYKPVKTEEIVNTVGAGNAMFSTFLHYYVKTGDAKEAIKRCIDVCSMQDRICRNFQRLHDRGRD